MPRQSRNQPTSLRRANQPQVLHHQPMTRPHRTTQRIQRTSHSDLQVCEKNSPPPSPSQAVKAEEPEGRALRACLGGGSVGRPTNEAPSSSRQHWLRRHHGWITPLATTCPGDYGEGRRRRFSGRGCCRKPPGFCRAARAWSGRCDDWTNRHCDDSTNPHPPASRRRGRRVGSWAVGSSCGSFSWR